MTRVYVEARPKGRPEGTRIEGYVIEDNTAQTLHVAPTQQDAIRWAKQHGHTPHVARVRHLNDKNKPDHWRSV